MNGGTTTQTILVLASFIIIIAGLKTAEPLVVPFLLAIFIATIAATPMFWLEKHSVPNSLAITLVVLSIVIVLSGMGALVAQSVNAFSNQLPFYQERLDELTNQAATVLAPLGYEFSGDLLSYFDPATALQMVGNTLKGLGGVLSNSFLILLTVIFILAEASSFPQKLRNILADPDQEMPHFALFAENVNRYMGIKTTISIATGIIITSYLALLGVDFPILWGLLAFLLNYVPTIGSIIAAIPAVLLAVVQLGPVPAAFTALGYVIVNLVMGNVVEPKFMGKGLGLSTLVVFLSLVFWGWMLGPVGMLLSVPLTMTAKIACEASPNTRWIAYLLGPAGGSPVISGETAAATATSTTSTVTTDANSTHDSETGSAKQ